jgi:hypothetical protein
MSLTSIFKTDERLETDGIVLDYGTTRIRVARAGGANKAFLKFLDQKTRPHRKLIAAGAMTNDQADAVLAEVYAESVVRAWETKIGNEWKSGISPEDAGLKEQGGSGNELLPVSTENILRVFKTLPDLFRDIQQQTMSHTLFRATLNEEALGN